MKTTPMIKINDDKSGVEFIINLEHEKIKRTFSFPLSWHEFKSFRAVLDFPTPDEMEDLGIKKNQNICNMSDL